MEISFVATRKNNDRTERELYEMDLLLRVLGFKRAFLDLGLFTVAGCTPPGTRIHVVDEYLEEVDYARPTDLVALSAKTSCVTRAYEVARRFREKGRTVVLGGIHASLRPEEALQHVDVVVTGEAETVWPQVVKDLHAGALKQRYDATGYPAMDAIPVPAWSATKAKQYLFQQVQTTRGCPFKCRFCSVPDISGQDFRFKPVEQVVRELRALPRGGSTLAPRRPLYVVDDNFISRTRYTKELLKALVPLYQNREIEGWSAETTLNVAADEELLDLFKAAGCATMIIGFESVSEATLQAMDKPVNFCITYQEAVERIHARGMTVVGNFIVGFDTDTRSVFKDTLEFVQKTGILYPFFSILTPMPGTGLFDDMKAAGRLDHERWDLYDTRHVVFEPKHMRRDELMDGYIWLYEQCYGTDLLLERLERAWRRRTQGASLAERLVLSSLLAPELVRGDGELRGHYKRSLALMNNRKLHTEPGQLLFVLDAYDFARAMRRWSTHNRATNYQVFRDPSRAPADAEEVQLRAMQWENRKTLARTETRKGGRSSLPVV
jgi:radical SAM superfamily enzyme YgiQ (UPF0313 family)